MAQVNSSSPARIFGGNLPLLSARAQLSLWNLGYVFSNLIGFSFPMPLDTLVESQREKICRAVIDVQYSGLRSYTSTAMLISCLLIPVPVSKITLQNEDGAYSKSSGRI